MKYIISILFLLILASCGKKVNENILSKNNNLDFFDPIIFDSKGLNIALNIKAEFSECGEFGGHKETMKVYTNQNKEFYLDYKKFKINCKMLENEQELAFMKTIEINKEEKKSITEYIHRLTYSKIVERNESSAANIFSINSSDSTLVIEVYDLNEYNIKSYNTLLKELKLL